MKKLLRLGILCALLVAALCVGALAADLTQGITGETTGTGVTITYYKEDGTTEVATVPSYASSTPRGEAEAVANFHAGAVRLTVAVTSPDAAKTYLLIVTEDTETPTENNIVYIDQKSGTELASGVFSVYPNGILNTDKTYQIRIASTDSALTSVATFGYYMQYALGDLTRSGAARPGIADGVRMRRMGGGLYQYTAAEKAAADLIPDGEILINDVVKMLRVVGGLEELN